MYVFSLSQAQSDQERFLKDLRRDIQKLVGFDAVMRVRTSTGESPVLEDKKGTVEQKTHVTTDIIHLFVGALSFQGSERQTSSAPSL